MQLTTVGKEVFRGARKALELAEAGAGDPTVRWWASAGPATTAGREGSRTRDSPA